MIVGKTKIKDTQTKNKMKIAKPTTLKLCLKNRNENKMNYETVISLHVESIFSSKHHIIKTQKHTKKDQSTHKLHSLHPFI
jgi:hypothetical protein